MIAEGVLPRKEGYIKGNDYRVNMVNSCRLQSEPDRRHTFQIISIQIFRLPVKLKGVCCSAVLRIMVRLRVIGCSYTYYTASYTYAHIGSRLCFLPGVITPNRFLNFEILEG